jgi:hypothetical protein
LGHRAHRGAGLRHLAWAAQRRRHAPVVVVAAYRNRKHGHGYVGLESILLLRNVSVERQV